MCSDLRRLGFLFISLAVLAPTPASAQEDIGDQIRRSQDRLEEIRQEQQQLTREATQMRGQIRTIGDEIRNIEARIGSSTSALAEFDVQIDAYAMTVVDATRDLLATRDEYAVRRTELEQRLRNI
jgi:peptidoglycan hydrolase CwlO-like protein